ncbi:MAG: hypothetical protein R3F34_03120 [Planctomycetota bacterium]
MKIPTLALGALLVCASCRSTIPARDPVGEPFPSVVGESLDGVEVRLPQDFAGAPVVLLVAFRQNAQFDLDRWILGLAQAATPVRVVEVPTIPGLVPGLFAGSIDGGMRRGIPIEDWGGVVTLYGDDARRVAEFTGTDPGLVGRVLLLDPHGDVVWSHARGYSAGALLELDARVRSDRTWFE